MPVVCLAHLIDCGLQVMLRRLFVLFAVLAFAVACASSPGEGPAPATKAEASSSNEDYRLGPEDKVKVSVFGETDLSGEFVVDSSGVLAAPFVGQISVKGMTLREFERAYAAKLRDAQILRDPRVSAEVTSFRPIYVLGEVKKPGQYAYVSGMTVQKAVALAEGYTYRASESTVEITRGGKKIKIEVTPVTKVFPGDEIRILERFF
jgi:polysaccharide export outer membrane protein